MRLIGKNRRRYGGYIIHIGVVMIFLAITGTSVFRQEKQVTVNPGESFEIGGYTLRYNGLEERDTPHIAYLMANIGVFRGGKQIDTLQAGEALLQEARAADHRGGDPLDARVGPLPGAGQLRRRHADGDDPRLPEPADRLPVLGRRRCWRSAR